MPLIFSKSDILRKPELSLLWKDNLSQSEDAKILDRAIADVFQTNHFIRPLMPMEIAAFTNEKELVTGTRETTREIRKELEGANAVEIKTVRNGAGEQLGRMRFYHHVPEWDYSSQ